MINRETRSFLYLYLLGALLALLSFYALIQYTLFKKEDDREFLLNTHKIQRSFIDILERHSLFLTDLSREISKQNLFENPSKMSDFLEKKYVYGTKDEKGEQIRISSINWIGKEYGFPVGRFGTLKYKLDFNPDYIERMKENPGKIEMSRSLKKPNSFSEQIINLGMGVRDNEKSFRGFITARIDSNDLIQRVLSQNTSHAVAFLLLDNEFGVVGSSLNISQEDRNKISTFLNEKNIKSFTYSKADYKFSSLLRLGNFPWSILVGSSKNDFYVRFFKYVYPQILALLAFSILLLLISYVYHKILLKKGWQHLKNKVEKLKKIINELSEENFKILIKKEDTEKILKCAEVSIREEKRFLLEVNKRVSLATADLIAVGKTLLEGIKDYEAIDPSPQEVMSVFERAYIHACFFCSKREERKIDITKTLNEVIRIHSYKMIKNNIILSQKVDQDVPPILSDEIAVKQVFLVTPRISCKACLH